MCGFLRHTPWPAFSLAAELLLVLLCALRIHAQAKAPPNPDDDCLACHGQSDLKSEKGKSVYVDAAKHKASVHAEVNCTACHTDIKEFPHPAKIKSVNCAACHAEPAADLAKGVHAALGADACTSCHGPAHEAQPAASIAPRVCAECHASEVMDFNASVHGAAAKNGDPQSPGCQSCHGPAHKIVPDSDLKSPVAKKNLPQTCAGCHSNPVFVARHPIPFAHPVEAYKLSVHGRATAGGNEAAASCSDCHGTHAIFSPQNPRSKINHWNVPATCGACHTEIWKTYQASVHGQAVAHGSADAPVCTDCHGEHNILAPSEPGSPVNPSRVSAVTCGRCHGNERLDARYNLPADRVPTYANSYHGLESRAGGQTVANCASCHGVHNIFPSSDPRSTINSANLAHTCGSCHPGAGTNFAIGPVHVRAQAKSENVVVKWIRLTYWVLIPFAVVFMFLHHLLDFIRKFRRKGPRSESGAEVMRMNLNFRIAHWLTVVSFPVLVVTGFALKFPEAWWAKPMLLWESRFAFRGLVHRAAAVVLLASLAYHIVHLIVVRRDRVILEAIIPRLKDAEDLVGMFLYNLGLSAAQPTFGKFNYVEKIEYLAFMWGTMVMALSGFILWFNNFALRYFPKWVSDAATALHYYEAILATFSILIWHLYTVIFDPDVYPMDRAWLTGKASVDHLHHTRAAYLEELLKAEKQEKEPPRDEKIHPKSPAGDS
ncbi:MAG TPA: cytochrome c3 family protein [Candidatus Sulfotelmatobacter sp.]|nr:cytochrome c3 family protein [Candidatus Sulfotelmatobacter sp.]